MKHERAIVMTLSYVIGFTTAFVAYAFSTQVETLTVTPSNTQGATVASVLEPQAPTVPSTFVQSEEGLFVVRDNIEKLVLVSYVVHPELSDSAYVSVHALSSANNGRFHFICATLADDADSCLGRIYDWETEKLYAVNLEGAPVRFDNQTVASAWASDGRLQVNQFASAEASTPWQLTDLFE